MFSFKNIKATFNEKVKNSENKTEMAVGVAEVAGKGLLAGATALVYHAPDFMMYAVESQVKKGERAIKEGRMSDDNAELFREKSVAVKEKADNLVQSRADDTKGFWHFLSNEATEQREVNRIKKHIQKEEKLIEELQENLKLLNNADKELADRLQDLIDNNGDSNEITEINQKISDNAQRVSEINNDIAKTMSRLENLYHRIKEYGVQDDENDQDNENSQDDGL